MTKTSIVITAWNAAKTIERAVLSVVAQTDPNWELIVIDNGSADDTSEILERLTSELGDDRIKVLSEHLNGGPGAARNRALQAATGDWITFLDSDDEYTPQRIATMSAAYGDDIDMVVCRHTIVGIDGTRRVRGAEGQSDLPGYRVAAGILTEEFSNYVWDKAFRTDAVRGLEFPDLRRAEDKVYVVAAALGAREVRFVDDALINYFVSPTSLTWGRAATIDETRILLDELDRVSEPLFDQPKGRDAFVTGEVVTWLAVAHQHLTLGGEATEIAQEFGWGDVWTTLGNQPLFGLAAAAFKLMPGPYGWLYRRYTKRSYGV